MVCYNCGNNVTFEDRFCDRCGAVQSQTQPSQQSQQQFVPFQEQQNQYITPQEQQYVSPQEQQYVPPQEQQYVPPQEQQYVPPQEQQYVPPQEQQYVPPQEQQYAPPQEQQQYAPSQEQQYVPPQEQQQYAPPQEQQYVPPHEQQYAPPQEQQYAPLQEQDQQYVAPPPEQLHQYVPPQEQHHQYAQHHEQSPHAQFQPQQHPYVPTAPPIEQQPYVHPSERNANREVAYENPAARLNNTKPKSNTGKVVICILLVLILIGGGLFFWLRDNDSNDYLDESTPENAVLSYLNAISNRDFDRAMNYLAYSEQTNSAFFDISEMAETLDRATFSIVTAFEASEQHKAEHMAMHSYLVDRGFGVYEVQDLSEVFVRITYIDEGVGYMTFFAVMLNEHWYFDLLYSMEFNHRLVTGRPVEADDVFTEVPDFIGMRLEDIERDSELNERFEFNVIHEVNYEVSEGVVFDQGWRYYDDRIIVTLIVSAGGEPTVEMPDLVHMSLNTAVNMLENLGFELIIDLLIESSDILEDTIISTTPAAGTALSRGSVVELRVSRGPDEPATASDDGFILPDSNVRYLTNADIAHLTLDELRIARNEIFARHGRLFDSDDLREHFEAQDWYHGHISPNNFSSDVFNSFEEANIELIQAREDVLS